MHEWIYFKAYVGAAIDRLDPLIVELIPAAVAAVSEITDCWFFLRYVDESGVHLRLRFKAASTHAARVRSTLDPICQQHLLRLPSLAVGTYRPAVALPMGELRIPPRNIAVISDVYEPEVAKFGVASMPIAERLFQASSEVAVGVLHGEQANTVSRKTLVPVLMDAVANAFPSGGMEAFWRRYAEFWLTSVGSSASDWRLRFVTKSTDLGERGIPVRAGDGALSAESRALVVRWRSALGKAAEGYRELGAASEAVRDGLGFHFVHLMNNRLGLSMLEEAYFATLLERSVARELAA